MAPEMQASSGIELRSSNQDEQNNAFEISRDTLLKGANLDFLSAADINDNEQEPERLSRPSMDTNQLLNNNKASDNATVNEEPAFENQ